MMLQLLDCGPGGVLVVRSRGDFEGVVMLKKGRLNDGEQKLTTLRITVHANRKIHT